MVRFHSVPCGATFVDGLYYATQAGESLVSEGREVFRSLKDQGFSENQRQVALDRKYENILIEEGELTVSNRLIARRSALLRRVAIKHFSDKSGSIACAGCGFRAEATYGTSTRGMIEIHHTRPLYLRTDVGLRRTITELLADVVPLCPNCHRVVHMDRTRCMPVSELKQLLAQHIHAAS
jgi:predicted HNH restriction endonuclease